MKSTYLLIAFGILLIFACNMEDDHFEITPESDLAALEGMDQAYDRALAYNDSLIVCDSEPNSCDSTSMRHYDEMFHQFDEMFNEHHGNYSHNNVDDDHHHQEGRNVRHGDMMNHDDDHGDESHEYEHNMETFEEMIHLREIHEDVHPK